MIQLNMQLNNAPSGESLVPSSLSFGSLLTPVITSHARMLVRLAVDAVALSISSLDGLADIEATIFCDLAIALFASLLPPNPPPGGRSRPSSFRSTL